MSLTARPFAGEADLACVAALRRAVGARHEYTPFIGDAELRATYLEPEPGWEQLVWLWEQDGALVGMGELAFPEAPVGGPIAHLRPRVASNESLDEIGPAIVAWAETEALARFGPGVTVEATVRREDAAANDLLLRLGYRLDRVFVRMLRPLDEPIRDRALPAGYVLRPLGGDIEIDAWLALYDAAFRDHYDFHPLNADGRRQEMRQPSYVPELDLVALAADGTPAAFCWTTKREAADGRPDWHINLVGTAREHRKRGLAGAMIASTIDRLLALGGGTVDLYVDATSETGANRLYERLGFREVTAMVDYRRTLSGQR